MKKLIFLTLFAALAMPQAVQADLLAGWDTFTNPDNGTVNSANATLAGFSGGAVTDTNVWGQTTTGGLAGNTYGSLATPLAGAGSHLSLNNAATGSVDFTITNSSGSDYDLDFFHFDAGTTRPGAADAWTLSVVSGAITTGDIANGANPNSGSGTALWTDYDIALGGLADNTLEAGQSVVFRLDFAQDSSQGPSGHHQYSDNFALTGTVAAIPEPSSLAILGLAGFGMLVRRRK